MPDILVEPATRLGLGNQIADDVVAIVVLQVPPVLANKMGQLRVDDVGAVERVDEEVAVIFECQVFKDFLDFFLGGGTAFRFFGIDLLDRRQGEADIVPDFLSFAARMRSSTERVSASMSFSDCR